MDTHQTPEVVGACLGVEVAPGSPGRVLGIDSLDELLRENVVMVLSSLDQDHTAQGHCEPHSKHVELRLFSPISLYVSGSDAAMLLRRKFSPSHADVLRNSVTRLQAWLVGCQQQRGGLSFRVMLSPEQESLCCAGLVTVTWDLIGWSDSDPGSHWLELRP